MRRISVRSLLLVLACSCGVADGQIAGKFSIEKQSYALGEPVFLYFEASNSGQEPQAILHADPYNFCADYEVHLSSDPSPTSTCPLMLPAGSCASTVMPFQPGDKYSERILLNYAHDITVPGSYIVDAQRQLRYGPLRLRPLPFPSKLEVHAQLHFVVDSDARFGPKDLEPWVTQLQSPDPAKRSEAGRTLASLAPPSLEDTLLGFMDKEDLRGWVPLAMHRLHTPRSTAALAELVRNTRSGTSEHSESVRFLGSSGDPRWFPLLLSFAQSHPGDGSYLYPAAESGGDRAVPFLMNAIRFETGQARQVAISAMAYTGSRGVIPFLLDLLKGPDMEASERALYGLEDLTHRKLSGATGTPQSQYPAWLQWWWRHRDTSHIYKPSECGEFTPLERD